MTTGCAGAARATLAGACALALLLYLAAAVPGFLLYVPPVAINLALLALFARTLRAGSEPMVSRFARIERGGTLPPDLARYTRNQTRAWAAFFALMAAISATLAATGPLAAWSLFSNLLNYLLVAVFFVLEYVYRRVRYRHHTHATPWRTLRLITHYGAMLRSHGRPLE